MSHFAVLVITDEKPTQEVIGRVLQPWHEYECTGVEDEYVVEVDVTDEVEKEWNRDSKVLKLTDGSIHCRYDEMFYTAESEDEFERRTGRKAFALPAGAVELTIPRHELCAIEGQSKIEFAEEYGEWKHKDGRFFNYTNPNAKWDWWLIGGRYSGRLHVSGAAEGRIGERSWTNKNEYITGVDQARRSDLDLAAMLKQAQHQRREWAEDCCSKAKRTMDELDIACRLNPLAHAKWMEIDDDEKPRGHEYSEWIRGLGTDYAILADFQRACFDLPEVPEGMTLTEWIEAAPAISAWAVIHDDQWFEKGEMGWFGMSSNDKDDWDVHFNKLWDLIGPDQWISIVDCHI